MDITDIVAQIVVVACQDLAKKHKRCGCCATWISARWSIKKYFEPDFEFEVDSLELELVEISNPNSLRWN